VRSRAAYSGSDQLKVPIRRLLDEEDFTVESLDALNPDEVAANHEVPTASLEVQELVSR
jgi:hypothetical protein